MRKQGFWQRWFGRSPAPRKAGSRRTVCRVEVLERRELLSAVGGATTTHYTYETMKAQLGSWATQYSGLVELVRIGQGAQAYKDPIPNDPRPETTRGLWAVKISAGVSATDDPTKPDVKYVGTMHGNEPLGMEMDMRFIKELLTDYGTAEGTKNGVTSLVQSNEIWVLPLVNPDGFANGTRANYNGYDLNRSFPNLTPLDPYAASKPSLASLEAALPTDRKGKCAVPEVKAVMDWSAQNDFILAANFHTGSLVVNYPYDNNGIAVTGQYAKSPDDQLYMDLSAIYASANPYMSTNSTFTTYNPYEGVSVRGITNGAAWFVAQGTMQDFDYRFFATKEVTVELYAGYDYGTKKAAIDVAQQWANNEPAMLAFMEQGIPLVLHSTPQPLVAAAATSVSVAGIPSTAQPAGALSENTLAALELSTAQRSANTYRCWMSADGGTGDDFRWSPRAVDMALTSI